MESKEKQKQYTKETYLAFFDYLYLGM
jgi:hypothetical protein